MNRATRYRKQQGFTLIEMLVVAAIAIVVTAMAIPAFSTLTQYLRIAGDLRNLNGVVSQAKMQAAANFTHARAYADLTTNTFHIDMWNANGNGGVGCWQTVGDPANPCTVAASPVQPLSAGNTFGFAPIAAPPPNTTPTIKQATACDDGTGGKGSKGHKGQNKINTACIVFNSRGIPIDATDSPDGTGAFYITNGNMVYGITVAATGLSRNWSISTTNTQAAWQAQ
ncbi:MAG: hypothetical protein PVS2B2_08570 [Candidatus Acidiferrum sp.]